jgi:hypothetical protein
MAVNRHRRLVVQAFVFVQNGQLLTAARHRLHLIVLVRVVIGLYRNHGILVVERCYCGHAFGCGPGAAAARGGCHGGLHNPASDDQADEATQTCHQQRK